MSSPLAPAAASESAAGWRCARMTAATGEACYTTARVEAGEVRYLERHAARLARDAARLGLGTLDPERCRRALLGLAGRELPRGAGIVRLEARRDQSGGIALAGSVRALGREDRAWHGITAPEPHAGPSAGSRAKRTGCPCIEAARERARAEGADEALLLGAEGFWVEGARSSLFFHLADGEIRTPPLSRGAVEGIARTLVLERLPEARERDVPREAWREVREIVCVNAVRGARALVRLDGRAVGDGRPGPLARHLARLLGQG